MNYDNPNVCFWLANSAPEIANKHNVTSIIIKILMSYKTAIKLCHGKKVMWWNISKKSQKKYSQ